MIKSALFVILCMYLSKLYVTNKYNNIVNNVNYKLNDIQKNISNIEKKQNKFNKESNKNKKLLSKKEKLKNKVKKEKFTNKKLFKLKDVNITNNNIYEPFNNNSNCYNYLKLK